MPPSVVNTMGKKARCKSTQPGRCFLIFADALFSRSASGRLDAMSIVAGSRGQVTVASIATTGIIKWKDVNTRSTFVPLVELEQSLSDVSALHPRSVTA